MRLLTTALGLLMSASLWAQSPSPDLPGALRVQIGSNYLVDEPSNMGLGLWGSKTFNAHYLYALRLGESRVSFHPGFGISTDKLSFDDDFTLQRNGNTVELVPLEFAEFGEVKKTKLATTYFEVPLEFRFHLNKDDFKSSVKIGVGGKIGVLMSSHTKVKYELDGETNTMKLKDSFELNRFRYGAQVNVGVAGISLYYYWGLNKLFKSGKGPEGTDATQNQFGIAFNLF